MMATKININQTQLIDYQDQFSLLDCLEEQQIPIEYNCRGGYCGLCKISLVQGQVIWVQDSLVSLQEQEILACCCVPHGPIGVQLP